MGTPEIKMDNQLDSREKQNKKNHCTAGSRKHKVMFVYQQIWKYAK